MILIPYVEFILVPRPDPGFLGEKIDVPEINPYAFRDHLGVIRDALECF